MVLTPRRRRQVRGWHVGPTGRGQNLNPRMTVTRKPGLRGEYKETVKTTRVREGRVFRCDRGDYTRVLPTHCTRGCGCNGHPAFPAPSVLGRRFFHNLGASRGESAKAYLDSSLLRGVKRRSNPFFLCAAMDCFASLAMTVVKSRHTFAFSRRDAPEVC